MADKLTETLFASHQLLVQSMQKQLDAIAAQGGVSPADPVKQREELLQPLKARLQTLSVARQEALQRYDDEIQRVKVEIGGHEAAIAAARKRATPQAESAARPKTRQK